MVLEEDKNKFRKDIRSVIKKHFSEFKAGTVYYLMREVFDEEIANVSIRTNNGKMKDSAKTLGINYKTFQKIRPE